MQGKLENEPKDQAMSELEIKEPDWINMAGDMFIDRLKLIEADLHSWFKSEVETINKLLREGKIVYGHPDEYSSNPMDHIWTNTLGFEKNPTHKALLINIQPIKPKTREEKLEDAIRDMLDAPDTQCLSEARVRAKKLLESKDE